LIPATAIGGAAAIDCASFAFRPRARRLERRDRLFERKASAASTIRPVISSSAARLRPTRRGKSQVPPSRDASPILTNVSPSFAASDAMR